MIQREIYQVTANIVDANGTFNPLSGYPKTFDSKSYDNDLEKTRQRAYGEWHQALADMGKRDDRQLQIASLVRISDGVQVENARFGYLQPLPEPEEETEPEPDAQA